MKFTKILAGASAFAAVAALVTIAAPTTAEANNPKCSEIVNTYLLKTLKINPKVIPPQQGRFACIRTGNKPALATRDILNGFVAKAKITAGTPVFAGCPDVVLYSMVTGGAPMGYSIPQNLGVACKNAKGRPALAVRNFSHRFLVGQKITMKTLKPAPAALAKTCPGRIAAVSKALKLNPKFASKNNIVAACKNAKGRPVVAMRNFTDRFVVGALKVKPVPK